MLETVQVLNDLTEKYEILIINDGSTDNTGPIADRLSHRHENIRIIHHETNRGYGAALISGFANSVNDWIFFTDGDNQFFIKEIALLLEETRAHDAVIGFRQERKDPWFRKIYANTWNLLVRLFLDLRIKDLNCAFKLIKKKSMEGISLSSSGALISAEILFKLKLSGANISEVAVSHKPRLYGEQSGGSPKVILKALLELFRLHREYKLLASKQ